MMAAGELQSRGAGSALEWTAAMNRMAPAIRRACHSEPIVRLAAVESLWCVGRGDEGAPAVTEMLAALAERGPDLTRADGVPTATCRVDGCWLDAGGCFERRWPLRVGHDDGEIAHMAAWLAGKVGAREAAPSLRSLARDLAGAWPILELAHGLARLGDPAGTRHLLALADGDDTHVGRQAIESLEWLGRRAVVPDLVPLLSATEREIRLAAARAILVLLARGRPAPEAAEAG